MYAWLGFISSLTAKHYFRVHGNSSVLFVCLYITFDASRIEHFSNLLERKLHARILSNGKSYHWLYGIIEMVLRNIQKLIMKNYKNRLQIVYFVPAHLLILCILGGGKKSKSWNLIRLTSLSHSLCSTDSENTKMSSEDPWEVLALDGSISYQNEAKIQRKWP